MSLHGVRETSVTGRLQRQSYLNAPYAVIRLAERYLFKILFPWLVVGRECSRSNSMHLLGNGHCNGPIRPVALHLPWSDHAYAADQLRDAHMNLQIQRNSLGSII